MGNYRITYEYPALRNKGDKERGHKKTRAKQKRINIVANTVTDRLGNGRAKNRKLAKREFDTNVTGRKGGEDENYMTND